MTADWISLAAVTTSGVFAGVVIRMSLVEHPARLACGTEIALRVWRASHNRATAMGVTLVVAAVALGSERWLHTGALPWALGAALLISVFPITVWAILPVEKQLLDPSRDPASADTRLLLETWGRRHAWRTILALASALLYASAAHSK
jgi:hypothetical protein